MNGGVHHTLETLAPSEIRAAIDGFAYFELTSLAEFWTSDPTLVEWTDDTEEQANAKYLQLGGTDEHLFAQFDRVLRRRPEHFAPLGPEGPGA